MKKSKTTPYHPMGNGMTERFNHTLMGMLDTLDRQQKSYWKAYVAPMVHVYNCIRPESTGVAPHFLLFGRQPRLPTDLAFGFHKDIKMPSTKYMQDLRDRLASASKKPQP
ncbi:uncharacterized protein [Mytilus edulis]|uniref:uncharacterized protein n=1 Tax=Mytilus edulis TaxID=6550 RepID=UPI0039EF06AF